MARQKEKIPPFEVERSLSVIVDYDRSLAEMIKVGNYSWIDFDISNVKDHFSINQKNGMIEKEVHLVSFSHRVSRVGSLNPKQIIQEMDENGFIPVDFPTFLAIGEQFSEEQRERPIVVLGKGSQCEAISLDGWAQGLHLVLLRWGGVCCEEGIRNRYAVVRKE